ncbi:MAG: methylmalonyl-CoA epimerase [Halobacteria archaeon]
MGRNTDPSLDEVIKVSGFDHVGVAVVDTEDAVDRFSVFGGLEHQEEFGEMVVSFVADGDVELLEPITDDSPVAGFIERYGEGIHHVAFEVSDLERSLGVLSEKGLCLVDEEPRDGARGKQVGFVHPSEFHGVLVELCEHRDG